MRAWWWCSRFRSNGESADRRKSPLSVLALVQPSWRGTSRRSSRKCRWPLSPYLAGARFPRKLLWHWVFPAWSEGLGVPALALAPWLM
jgi:hypothetical protein